MSSCEPSPVSRTHERAILEQDNGELAEDIVARRSLDEDDQQPDRVDEEGEASFPASDPPPSWAREPPPDEDDQGGRVVALSEVVHPPERAAPDDPVPKTLPREGPPGRAN